MSTIGKAIAGSTRYSFGRVFRFLHTLSGWLTLYLALGAVLGMAFWEHGGESGYCIPKLGHFATLGTNCPIALVNGFWLVAVGLPRLAVIVMAVPLTVVFVGIKTAAWATFCMSFHC